LNYKSIRRVKRNEIILIFWLLTYKDNRKQIAVT
jgi:hypothetical protein